MLFFDSDPSSREVQERLGVKFELVSKNRGVGWEEYKTALERSVLGKSADLHDTLFCAQLALGKPLGHVKVMNDWSKELTHRFLQIYAVTKRGEPFIPGNSNVDQYLSMIAFELRNLDIVGQLKAPKPENFTGWFTMSKLGGTPLWKTPLYQKHPFSVPFQSLIKTAFHLIVDEIEYTVQNFGIEHRDGHLANVYFDMRGDLPVKAHLLDWGIAVRMTWDGKRYIRGDDILVWADSEAGVKYAPEEFRQYWITWMVKTEYEANMNRNAITERDARDFLKDLSWWYRR